MSSRRIKKLVLILASTFAGSVLTVGIQANADKNVEVAPAPLPLNELRTFAEVFGRIKQDYIEPIEDKKLITDAIKGMVSNLDPHSDYLDSDAFKELREGTQGEFGGLGIEIGAEDGLVKVISPIEDTPAFNAGIKSGDLIVKIDDLPVRGLSPSEAVKRMRGKPGTQVTLTILRKTEPKPLVIVITRAIIKTISVKSGLLEPNYGYVRITQFQEHTTANLADAIAKLYTENKQPLQGVVLDLRGNPGGLLTSAVGVAAAFLPQDTLVVYTEGRIPESKMRLTASLSNYALPHSRDPLASLPGETRTVPLAVLVNVGSASASEIVAGALQDSKRAIIIGTQTFGKGSVQTILPLGSNGGLKLTTARYFTPNGRSIQAKGILPDIVVEDAILTSSDKTLSVREADLEHHLQNLTSSSPVIEKKTPVRSKAAPDKSPYPADTASTRIPNPKTDYQLTQALNSLKVQHLLKRSK